MFGDSRFDFGITRKRAARTNPKAFSGFLLGDAIVAHTVINDDACGLLRKHQPRTFRFTIASSCHRSEQGLSFFLLFFGFRIDARCVVKRIQRFLRGLAFGDLALSEHFEDHVALTGSCRAAGFAIDQH